MKKFFSAAILAVAVLAAFSAQQAQAAYCGACSYVGVRPCACEFTTQCNTVMKTCRKVVFEKEQVVCYRNAVQKVPVTRQVTCTRYVPERQARQITYTVNRTVWENCQKTVTRTVNKVVYETVQKQVPYTVMVPVTEQKTREAVRLLKKAGYAMTHSSKFDIAMEFFIRNRIYDVMLINEYLFDMDMPLLGSVAK